MSKRQLPVLIVLLLVPRAAAAQGDPLGPEFRVNTYTTDFQVSSAIAVDSSGNFVVAWSGIEPDGTSGVFGQRYMSGGVPVGPEFRVNTYTTGHQYAPAVGSDPSGNFVVVWNDSGQDGSYTGVFAQRYASSGAPLGPEFRVNTHTTSYQRVMTNAVAVGGSGDFVVVWESKDQDGSQYGVFGQRYSSSGAPVGTEFQINTYTDFSQYRPTVAADSGGNFVVVWESFFQATPAGTSIHGQRFASSGAPLGPEFRVNTYVSPTATQRAPSVQTNAAGDFVAVWHSEQEGSVTGVYGQRFAGAGAPLGPEFRVNTYTTGYQAIPDVALDAAGNFVVVWLSDAEDGSTEGIFGQRYASTGTLLGPEFRVNTYTTGGQSGPHVAADTLGNFVVVWDSELQDGSEYGVFGQRYSQIVPVELMHFGIE
jgi:hypothetical protein